MAISDQNMQRWLPQQGGGSPGPQMGARDVLALLTGGGGNSVYMGNRGMQGQGFAKPLQMQPMPQPMMPQPMQGEQPMQARGGGGHGGGAQSTALARLLMQMSQQRPEMPMTYTF